MIVAGIDIGSRAAKAVLMKDGKIVSTHTGDTGPESVKTSYATMAALLKNMGIEISDIEYIVATGYGRVLVPFANENISEISCHARGITWYYPSVRTILDMGGQDCKAINCDGNGAVTNFIMNDKCAGGTGRFLEMIADVLNVPLKDIGTVSQQSQSTIPFTTICAVFAKSEAIGYLRRGIARSDILAGLNDAISTRCLNLLKRVSIQSDFTITGGISKNSGMVTKIAEKVGMKPLLCEDPQLVGALGAALFAEERSKGVKGKSVKAHYGYSDGTGDYFIVIDAGACDGCGECVTACPSQVLVMEKDDSGQPKAKVKDTVRRKLANSCPGFNECSAHHGANCHSICKKNAINHTW